MPPSSQPLESRQRFHWFSILLLAVGLAGILLFVFSDLGKPGAFWANKGYIDFLSLGAGCLLLGGGVISVARAVAWDRILGKQSKRLAVLMAVSLGIRLAVALPVYFARVGAIDDEGGYAARADAANNLLEALAARQPLNSDDVDWLFAGGDFPPLTSIVSGIQVAALPVGDELGMLRLLMVAISALTTPAVYLLTLQLSDQKSATAAALVHAVYPSFVAYSHYVQSETLFLFLLVLTLLSMFKAAQAPTLARRILYAILCGVALGLAGLTRAAVLPFLIIVPLATASLTRERTAQRLLAAVVVAGVAGSVLLPWELLQFHYQHRFVLIANTGEYNLFAGNNPWLPRGISSAEGLPIEEAVRSKAQQYAEGRDLSISQAYREIALREVTRYPARFVQRSLLRLAHFWNVDYEIINRILRVSYPPLPRWALPVVWMTLGLCLLAFSFFSVAGFAASPPISHRWLWLILLVGYSGIPIISMAFPRLSMPALILLTPVVGYGVAHPPRFRRPAFWGAVAAAALTLLAIFATVPETMARIYGSTYYGRWTARIGDWFDLETHSYDRVEFRNSGTDSATLTIAAPAPAMIISRNSDEVPMTTVEIPPSGTRGIVVSTTQPETAVRLQLAAETSGEGATLEPVAPASWNNWRLSGIDGVEYRWTTTASRPVSHAELPEEVRDAPVP